VSALPTRPVGVDSLDDHRLIAEIGAGRTEAFAAFYDRYCQPAYRVARSVTLNRAQAEDAVQEAFLSVWRSAGAYQPQGPTAAAWLLTIVRHRAIDLARRTARHEVGRALDAPREDQAVVEDVVVAETLARDRARQLRAQLAGLPEAQREVIVLAFFGQLTYTEIAAQLDLPLSTIAGRIRLGLHKLHEQIADVAA
jgi:RNA polymerase sigma-70 factor (ECF subfamily)